MPHWPDYWASWDSGHNILQTNFEVCELLISVKQHATQILWDEWHVGFQITSIEQNFSFLYRKRKFWSFAFKLGESKGYMYLIWISYLYKIEHVNHLPNWSGLRSTSFFRNRDCSVLLKEKWSLCIWLQRAVIHLPFYTIFQCLTFFLNIPVRLYCLSKMPMVEKVKSQPRHQRDMTFGLQHLL